MKKLHVYACILFAASVLATGCDMDALSGVQPKDGPSFCTPSTPNACSPASKPPGLGS